MASPMFISDKVRLIDAEIYIRLHVLLRRDANPAFFGSLPIRYCWHDARCLDDLDCLGIAFRDNRYTQNTKYGTWCVASERYKKWRIWCDFIGKLKVSCSNIGSGDDTLAVLSTIRTRQLIMSCKFRQVLWRIALIEPTILLIRVMSLILSEQSIRICDAEFDEYHVHGKIMICIFIENSGLSWG